MGARPAVVVDEVSNCEREALSAFGGGLGRFAIEVQRLTPEVNEREHSRWSMPTDQKCPRGSVPI